MRKQIEIHEEEDDLLNLLMDKVHWAEAVALCDDNPDYLKSKLTMNDDTVLHVVVSSYDSKKRDDDDDEKHVKNIINNAEKQGSPFLLEVLSMRSVRGDTPLHLAAAVGWTDICRVIASKDPITLVRTHNIFGETPLFLAANYGKEGAYLCLHETMSHYNNNNNDRDYFLCRRKDGNTILHKAIYGEFFSIASHIIKNYPYLVNSVNVYGESPLHVLAKKPELFQRSSQLNLYQSIIYDLICIDDDKKKQEEHNPEASSQNRHSSKRDTSLPGNYFNRIYKSFSAFVRSCKNQNCSPADEENQQKLEKEKKDDSQGDGARTSVERAIDIVTGGACQWICKVRKKKEMHYQAIHIMEELITHESRYKYYSRGGQKPAKKWEQYIESEQLKKIIQDAPSDDLSVENTPVVSVKSCSTPLLEAAKWGIPEMVEKIIETFPSAIQDVDFDEKNLVMVAVENRQLHVFDRLMKLKLPEYMFLQMDNEGNSIHHLAAKKGDFQPWKIPGVALHLQWQLRWYEHVRRSIPPFPSVRHNFAGKTPKELLAETHEDLVKEATDSLKTTSKSSSVVAALVTTVAFASCATIPGDFNEDSGYPIFQDVLLFDVFSFAALVALCLSVAALVLFLTIVTARFQQSDFQSRLPKRLFAGLTCLFGSLIAMLLSFFAAHTFILSKKRRWVQLTIYSIAILPILLFAVGYLPFYADLLHTISRQEPLRRYKVYPKKSIQTQSTPKNKRV